MARLGAEVSTLLHVPEGTFQSSDSSTLPSFADSNRIEGIIVLGGDGTALKPCDDLRLEGSRRSVKLELGRSNLKANLLAPIGGISSAKITRLFGLGLTFGFMPRALTHLIEK